METDTERRRRQNREAVARYQAKNKEKAKVYAAARRAANLEEFRRKDREAKKQRYHADPVKVRAIARAYAAKHKEAARVKAAEWRKKNPERVKELSRISRQKRKERWEEFLSYERKRYHKNPGKRLEQQKVYRSDPSFLPRARAYSREYLKRNPEFSAIKNAERKAAKLNATPHWCDLDAIAAIYQQARQLSIDTGIAYEVDHIVPLRSKHVCGLHVPCNLQILTSSENRRKHNKLFHGEILNSGPGEIKLPPQAAVQNLPPAQGALGLYSSSSKSRENSGVRDGSDRPRIAVQNRRRAVRLHESDLHTGEGSGLGLFEALYC